MRHSKEPARPKMEEKAAKTAKAHLKHVDIVLE